MTRTRLSWYLARRHLSSRKNGKMLSVITWIALGGVIVGVTALVVVIGVMTGMQEEFREKILGSTPHIMVRQAGLALRLDGWQEVVRTVEGVEGVVSASPLVLTKVAILRSEQNIEIVDLYGVDIDGEGEPLMALEDSLRSGQIPLRASDEGLTRVAIGSGIAQRMGLFPGDTVIVLALENLRMGPFGEMMPRMVQWQVSGVFTTGLYDLDVRNGYATLDAVQGILGLDSDVTSFVGVRTENAWAAEEIATAISEELGGWPYLTSPWTELNQQLFSAIELEKLAMSVILSLIVLVAAFNIVSTLTMVVVNRTREIGILKAMGMTRKGTLHTFMLQGLWIGVIGTLTGVGVGLLLGFLIEHYGLIRLPANVYMVDRLPVTLSPWDVLWIAGVSMLISLLATIYPARQASRLDPVEAIRYE